MIGTEKGHRGMLAMQLQAKMDAVREDMEDVGLKTEDAEDRLNKRRMTPENKKRIHDQVQRQQDQEGNPDTSPILTSSSCRFYKYSFKMP